MEQSKKQQAKGLVDEALAKLAADLEAGNSKALKTYLATLARFHSYSFRNILLIASQRPDATNVAGFRTWKKLGRWVRKGEKGIIIIAPMPIPARDDATDEERAEMRFRAVHVFDISQTDGEDLAEFSTVSGNPLHYLYALRQFIEQQAITLVVDNLDGALGRSHGGRITITPDLSPAEEFSVLAHELAHEFLHHDKNETPPPKTVRETEAEAVAFTVCTGIGLETNHAAADYIKLYNGDAETLAASLARIQETATRILSAITETDDQAKAA